MNDEIDNEEKIYHILGILKDKEILNTWKNLNQRILKYFELEWGVENPPTLKEITNVVEQFSTGDKEAIKIGNELSVDDFVFLLTFMVVGFDTIINGEKSV